MNMTMPRFSRLAVASLTGLAACGSPAAPRMNQDLRNAPSPDFTMVFDEFEFGGPIDMTMLSEDELSEPAEDLARPQAYPPGPYGSKIGDTFALAKWEGYINPGANSPAINAPYRTLSTADLHSSGKRFG